MRAAVFATILSHLFDIHLVVINLWDRAHELSVTMRPMFTTVRVISIRQLSEMKKGKSLLTVSNVSHIHVFRIQLARFIHSELARMPHRLNITLDMDDYESVLYRRMSDLYFSCGDVSHARMLSKRAARFSIIERDVLPLFDQVFLASPADRLSLATNLSLTNVALVENVIKPHSITRQRKVHNQPVRLLFVGTLDYFPNEDAICWFCNKMLPLLRQVGAPEVCVQIVGSRPTRRVRDLASIPNVLLIGEVDKIDDFYRQADFAIVPLRAGSGTRIKVLESLNFGCPVVSTSLGVEGLDVKAGEQVLVGDSEVEFVQACVALIKDAALCKRLGEAGRQWVRRNHSIARAERSIRSYFDSVGHSYAPRAAEVDLDSVNSGPRLW